MRSLVRVWLVCLVMLGASNSALAEELQPRIIGGTAAPAGEYDFFATIMIKLYWRTSSGIKYHWNPICGGSYIGEGVVLTAAHCLDDFVGKSVELGIVVGDQSNNMAYEYCKDTNTNFDCVTQDRAAICLPGFSPTDLLAFKGNESEIFEFGSVNIRLHPQYTDNDFGYDVGLVDLGTVDPGQGEIALAELAAESEYSDFATVIGHGETNRSSQISTKSAQLLEVDLPIVGAATCQASYGKEYDETMICAGYSQGVSGGVFKDSCQGDSGGPLFIEFEGNYVQRGIVSFGVGCANTYGVYSNVSELNSWINTNKNSVVNNRSWMPNQVKKLPALDSKQSQVASLTTRDLCGSSRTSRFFGGGAFSPWWLLLAAPLLGFRRTRKGPLALVLLSTLGLVACSSNPFASEPPEVVFNPAITAEGLEFSVMSNGCTQENHLLLRVKGDDVEVVRTQPDMCRAAPQLKRFVMPLPEQESVWQLENPVRYSNRVSREG